MSIIKQAKLPRRNWTGVAISLVVVIASGTGVAYQVAELCADPSFPAILHAAPPAPATDDSARPGPAD